MTILLSTSRNPASARFRFARDLVRYDVWGSPLLGVFWCFFACLFLMAFSAHRVAASGPWLDVTVEQAKAQAATLIKEGKNPEAFTLLMALLREVPDDPEVNMALARAATAVGEHNQAVLALERLADAYPKDAGLRIALARAHLRTGDDDAARREFEFAKTIDPELSDAIADTVLAKLESEYKRWQVSGKLSGGVIYDSNVNMGPGSALVQLGIWQLLLDPDATSKESWGAYSSATLDAAWRTGPESPWWIVGDVTLYRKGMFADINSSRELSWARAALGFRHFSTSTLFDLRFKSDAADYMSDSQVAYSNGPELLFIYAPASSLQLMTRAALERRDYMYTTGRQGWYFWAGEYLRYIFTQKNHDITLGGRYLTADTTQNNYGYDGWEASLRASLNLPYDISFSPFILFRKENYNGPATALEFQRRKDENIRSGATIVWNMTPALALDATYQYTKNTSVSAIYTYDQHLLTVGMSWKF